MNEKTGKNQRLLYILMGNESHGEFGLTGSQSCSFFFCELVFKMLFAKLTFNVCL